MSHSGPVIPAFVDLTTAEQAAEILAFLKGLGAEVSGRIASPGAYIYELEWSKCYIVGTDDICMTGWAHFYFK